VYLSGSSPQAGDEREKAISTLCAAVFLQLPLRLLSMSRDELRFFFSGPSSSSRSFENKFENGENSSLSWQEICVRYRRFVLRGTASLMSSIGAIALVTNLKKDTENNKEKIRKNKEDKEGEGSYFSDLLQTIKRIRGDNTADKKITKESMTLEQYLQFCTKNAKDDTISNTPAIKDNSTNNTNDNDVNSNRLGLGSGLKLGFRVRVRV
jgi:hypothetical protein